MATPQVQNDPIYSLPYLYISGLDISISSTTTLAIAPGQARDSRDNIDLPVGFPDLQNNVFPPINFQDYQNPLIINSRTNGALGLDTGTIAASTQYAVYLIGDSRGYRNISGIMSLTSNSGPLLPLGYDSYRLLGFIQTDGSSNFVYATHKPQNMANALSFYNYPPTSVLSGGNATTFTVIDLTTNSAVPTTTLPNVIVLLEVFFTPGAAGDVVQFRPTGSTATANLPTITGIAAHVPQVQFIQVIAGVGSSKPEIDYLVTSSGDSVSVFVAGWIGVSNTAYPALV